MKVQSVAVSVGVGMGIALLNDILGLGSMQMLG